MQELFTTLKTIAIEIQSLLTTQNANYLESHNTTGDKQLAIDVMADRLIESRLLELECVRGVCSEEKAEAVKKESGDFLIAYDPLDGSSLVDSNLAIGSIFGIYTQDFQAKYLAASAYIVYGNRLEIVFGDEKIHHEKFLPKENTWQALPPLKLHAKGKLNSPGGTQKNWSRVHKNFIDSLFAQGYRLRYSGGMVPDLHQILVKGGGLFSYPATSDAPNGKLRKLFEAFPFAFIYERCGGMATDGERRLLDLGCDCLHQSTACFFGSISEIEALMHAYKQG